MKKNNSNKPINRVILMGKDKDGHKIYHVNGILPSLNTKIYIPKH